MQQTKNQLQHIAIIMDGNGRWAKQRFLPRIAGHIRGVKRVKEIVTHCLKLNIKYLTLFAFGRDNWKRPKDEVSFLMKLLEEQLKKEFIKLHEQNIKVRFIGDKSRLNPVIIQQINYLQQLTINNQDLHLNIALDYSGSYDIIQAINTIITQEQRPEIITESDFTKYLLTYPDPNPDLLIRTSGEARISDFMLWQIAYSECYFTDTLWPDFKAKDLNCAIEWFQNKERRFGMTSEQIIPNLNID